MHLDPAQASAFGRLVSMRKLWLIFSQTATIGLAVLFVVSTLRPDLLSRQTQGSVATVREQQPDVPGYAITSFRNAARKALPAVVNIYNSEQLMWPPLTEDSEFPPYFGEQRYPGTQRDRALGSGVIVSGEGYILTNHHVIEEADQIEVALADRRKVTARVVGSDPETDLAVLKIDLDRLPSITFGQAEEVHVGDVVLAIGNPFGAGQTVTIGIVSGLGRSRLGITTFENFIQTDAANHPGNSGGALVDANGNLIGINTATYSLLGVSLGVGYAIPVNIARQVMEQIIREGSVTRGWIGVGVEELTRWYAELRKLPGASGALISNIERGSPAERAGVRLGDILLAVNGEAVADTTGALHLIAALRPGQRARLTIARDQKETDLTVAVGRRPRPPR